MKPLLYGELAKWYRLVDPPADHEIETEHYTTLFDRVVDGSCTTLLELGSGAGHNAVHLKRRFRCTLAEPAEAMRALAAELNPECEHVEGDMRTLRLGRTFDAVLVHDAICYMTSREDLAAAAATVFMHTRPGGAALLVPDCVRETFVEATESLGEDDGQRSARFLMWTWDPDPNDETYRVDFAFLFRDGDVVTPAHDVHLEGVFPRAVWIDILRAAGFEVEVVQGPSYEEGTPGLDMFLCKRPRA